MEIPARQRRADKDVVLDREDTGEVYTSLPWQVQHYGVETFDWGYIGPASAELALNILNWVLPVGVDGEPAIQCERGECSAIAWRLHRSFMAEFLVRVPYEGGCLRETEIRRWILQHYDDAHPGEAVNADRRPGWFRSFIQG